MAEIGDTSLIFNAIPAVVIHPGAWSGPFSNKKMLKKDAVLHPGDWIETSTTKSIFGYSQLPVIFPDFVASSARLLHNSINTPRGGIRYA